MFGWGHIHRRINQQRVHNVVHWNITVGDHLNAKMYLKMKEYSLILE